MVELHTGAETAAVKTYQTWSFYQFSILLRTMDSCNPAQISVYRFISRFEHDSIIDYKQPGYMKSLNKVHDQYQSPIAHPSLVLHFPSITLSLLIPSMKSSQHQKFSFWNFYSAFVLFRLVCHGCSWCIRPQPWRPHLCNIH